MVNDSNKRGSGPPENELFFTGPDSLREAVGGNLVLQAGSYVGHYRVAKVLGEGGYGLVYLAEQEEPIRRKVAVKVIKPGMDSREVLRRFEAERQALALLGHPSIAQIFDAGTTDTGQPFFAMEYIDGLPITEYCDRHTLPIEDRLRIFLEACGAAEHAHQKGIIHRDIKPTNILVSLRDGKPAVKVIDFGVARAIDQPLGDRTLATARGQLIGTPEYMSPEQVDMSSRDVDTRSDVYSLGAVLYELLAGHVPFDMHTLCNGGVEKMREMICKQDPLRPSTRVSRSGERGVEIARRRRTDIAALTRSLRSELEWIPLKAMRKERTERYRSAAQLADDIENYLSGSPLLAGPESVIYRTKKMVKRYRVPLAAIATVLVVLLVGLIASAAMYLRAERLREDEQRARIDEAQQRKTALLERDRAAAAERKAERALADLYEEQGRKSLVAGDLDEAMLFLSEAYQIGDEKPSLKLLLAECMRRHEDPAFGGHGRNLGWAERFDSMKDLLFSISSDREMIALVDSDDGSIAIFDTRAGTLKHQPACDSISQLVIVPGNEYLLVKTHDDGLAHTLRLMDVADGGEVFSTRRDNVDLARIAERVDCNLPSREQLEAVFESVFIDPRSTWLIFARLGMDEGGLTQELGLFELESNMMRPVGSNEFDVLMKLLVFQPRSLPYRRKEIVSVLQANNAVRQWMVPGLEPGDRFTWDCDVAVFDPQGVTFIYTVDSEARLMDRSGNVEIRRFPQAESTGYSPDGRLLVVKQAASGDDGGGKTVGAASTSLWGVEKDQRITELGGEEVINWHFTPDSRYLVTEHVGGHIKIWRTSNGTALWATRHEESWVVADISLDSRQLLTRSHEPPYVAKIWNLDNGDSCGPYQVQIRGTDIAGGLVRPSIDGVFSYSLAPPRFLLRFNRDGSSLITASGLLPVASAVASHEHVKALVEAHIRLRLENGRIRPATTEEMLLAQFDYSLAVQGKDSNDTVLTAAHAIGHEIEAGALEKALKVARKLDLPRRKEDASAESGSQGIMHPLFDAYAKRADSRARQGRYADAIADYKLALSLYDHDPRVLDGFAWLEATCPDARFRNGPNAVVRSRKACDLTDWQHWRYLSTHAVSLAQTGGFARAVHFQRQAIQRIPLDQRDKWAGNYEVRLRLLESGKRFDRMLFLNLPSEHMIGWWTFDELEGDVAYDQSGNGHDGYFNTTAKRHDGKIGGAFLAENPHDYVTISATPALDCGDAMTVMAWVWSHRPRQEPSYRGLVSRGASSWTMGFEEWGVPFIRCRSLNLPSDYPRAFLDGVRAVKPGHWYHVAAVYDGSSLSLYVDGVPDTYTPAYGAVDADGGDLNIGIGPLMSCFDGMIDDVRLYNCALNNEEIRHVYLSRTSTSGGLTLVTSSKPKTMTGLHESLQMDAVAYTSDFSLESDSIHFEWCLETGPGQVVFSPNAHTRDPSVRFSKTGVYQFSVKAMLGNDCVEHRVTAIVYPQGHDGLVAHYTFDSGDANDHSLNGIHGTLAGDAAVVFDVQRGYVLHLHGDGDYVNCGADPRFDLTESLTLAAWIKADPPADTLWDTIVGKGDYLWTMQRLKSGRSIEFGCDGICTDRPAPRKNGVLGRINVFDGQWHHIAGVFDGSRMSLYVDGVLDQAERCGGSAKVNTDEPVYIGGLTCAESRFWKGMIDDVRIYSRPLSPSEIAELHTKTR